MKDRNCSYCPELTSFNSSKGLFRGTQSLAAQIPHLTRGANVAFHSHGILAKKLGKESID